MAHCLIRDVGTFHNLIDFERLLAERRQDIFSIIQHDCPPTDHQRHRFSGFFTDDGPVEYRVSQLSDVGLRRYDFIVSQSRFSDALRFSFFFLLLDEPQARETNGDDHHGDENGVLHHRNFPELRQVAQPVDRCARAPLVKLPQVPLSELLPQGPLSQWT